MDPGCSYGAPGFPRSRERSEAAFSAHPSWALSPPPKTPLESALLAEESLQGFRELPVGQYFGETPLEISQLHQAGFLPQWTWPGPGLEKHICDLRGTGGTVVPGSGPSRLPQPLPLGLHLFRNLESLLKPLSSEVA